MIVSLANVTRYYYLDRQRVIAPVRDVTLEVSRGEFILIVGRSGSGKTTLLNLMAGLIKPSSGDVSIDGVSLHGIADRQLSLLRSQKIGFVFQVPSLLPALNVIENIVMPAVFSAQSNKRQVRDKAAKLVSRLGLAEKTEVYPRQLSAGEQKRVAIARALINQPALVLADEPTADLDEKTEQDIMELLCELNSAGTTIVMVTHATSLTPFANRTLEMRDSSLLSVIPSLK